MKLNGYSRRKFLRTSAIGAVGLLVNSRSVVSYSPQEINLYVGTYTSGKSEGIYLYRMNSLTGELRRLDSTTRSVNPSFLVIDQSRKYLYAVNEVADFEGQRSGAVSAFSIQPGGGKLTFLNQQPSLGADPCHLSLNREGKLLFVANYTGGSVSVLPVRSDGSLGPATDSVQHQGSGIREQQKGPHAHCIILDRSEKYALAADLGTDKIAIYRVDSKAGKLRPNSLSLSMLRAGAGPRHMTFHPNGKYLYVINELDSTMSAFAYDARNGILNLIQTLSTLPADFSGTSYCADLHISPDGRFLYGSNRGHDSIVSFSIDARTGRLQKLEHVSTGGKWPRNFAIDPLGRFLLVANQRTDSVVTFSIDRHTGRLKPTDHVAEIPVPVCLRFA